MLPGESGGQRTPGGTDFEELLKKRGYRPPDELRRASEFEKLLKRPTEFEKLLKKPVTRRVGGAVKRGVGRVLGPIGAIGGILIPSELGDDDFATPPPKPPPKPPAVDLPPPLEPPDVPARPTRPAPFPVPIPPPPSIPRPEPPVIALPAPGPLPPTFPTPLPPRAPRSNKTPKPAPKPARRPMSRSIPRRFFPWPNVLSRKKVPVPRWISTGVLEGSRPAMPSPADMSSVPVPRPSNNAEPAVGVASPGFSSLTALQPQLLRSAPPSDCTCPKPTRKRKRPKRPSKTIANVTPFKRRMSEYSLRNLKRGK